MSTKPVIIVTGAAGGIGYSTVRFLIEEYNARVVASDVVAGNLPALAEQHPESLLVKLGDISQPETSPYLVKLALANYGQLDGICLLAGIFGPCHRLEATDPRDWQRGYEINLFSHIHMYKAALPHLRKTRGRIVCATSGAGHGALFAGWGFYGTTKAAVAFCISQLRLEEPEVTSIGVSPGLCDTNMIRGLIEGQNAGQTTEDVRRYKDFVSKVEMITPDEAGRVMSRTVVLADASLSGRVFDYNDPQLFGGNGDVSDAPSGAQKHIDYTNFT